jgi:hypothetical protein
MKHSAMVALMLNFGVAGAYAQQRPTNVRMTFSGSFVPTAIEVRPNTITDEELLEGNGALGRFTFRKLRADETTLPRSAVAGPALVQAFASWPAAACSASQTEVSSRLA